MPENDHQHPRRTLPEDGEFAPNPRAGFVELGVASCFSFLRGASEAVDLVRTAWEQGYDAIGIADLNSFAGVVRRHVEAKKAGLRPVIGVRLALVTGEQFLAYPRDRDAYGRLCRLISKGRMQTVEGGWQEKGACEITLADLAAHEAGSVLIAVPPEDIDRFGRGLPRLCKRLKSLRYVAASWLYRGDDRARLAQLSQL